MYRVRGEPLPSLGHDFGFGGLCPFLYVAPGVLYPIWACIPLCRALGGSEGAESLQIRCGFFSLGISSSEPLSFFFFHKKSNSVYSWFFKRTVTHSEKRQDHTGVILKRRGWWAAWSPSSPLAHVSTHLRKVHHLVSAYFNFSYFLRGLLPVLPRLWSLCFQWAPRTGGELGSWRWASVKIATWGASLVVQWLRLCAPNAEGPGLNPGQGTRSHMTQLRPSTSKQIKLKKKKIDLK